LGAFLGETFSFSDGERSTGGDFLMLFVGTAGPGQLNVGAGSFVYAEMSLGSQQEY
jgi:hypothetical protein